MAVHHLGRYGFPKTGPARPSGQVHGDEDRAGVSAGQGRRSLFFLQAARLLPCQGRRFASIHGHMWQRLLLPGSSSTASALASMASQPTAIPGRLFSCAAFCYW